MLETSGCVLFNHMIAPNRKNKLQFQLQTRWHPNSLVIFTLAGARPQILNCLIENRPGLDPERRWGDLGKAQPGKTERFKVGLSRLRKALHSGDRAGGGPGRTGSRVSLSQDSVVTGKKSFFTS